MSVSSCHGSECDDPHVIDHDHEHIQLDSLEDLAHVIDDEIIHRSPGHEHVERAPQPVREYAPFIVQEEEPKYPTVDVAPVTAPTYEEVAEVSTYTPYQMPARPTTTYSMDALPDFGTSIYSKAPQTPKPYQNPEPDHGHGHHDDDDHHAPHGAPTNRNYAEPAPKPAAP